MKEKMILRKEELIKKISPNEISLQAFQSADTHRTASTIVEDDQSVSMTYDENLSITGDESVSISDENISEASTDKHSMPPQPKWKLPYQQVLRGPKSSKVSSKASIRKLQVTAECVKVTSKIKQPLTSNFKGKSPYQQSLRQSVKSAMRSKPSATSLKVTNKVTDKAVKEVSTTTRHIPTKPKWKSPYEQSLRPASKLAMRNRMSMPNLQITSKITDNALKDVSKNKRPIPSKPTWKSPYEQSLRPASKLAMRNRMSMPNLQITSKITDNALKDVNKNKRHIPSKPTSESPYKQSLRQHKPTMQSKTCVSNLEAAIKGVDSVVKKTRKNKQPIILNSNWESPYEQSFGQSLKPAKQYQTSMPNLEIASEEADSISESNNNKFAGTSIFKGYALQQRSILAIKPAIRIQTDMPNIEETDESITEIEKNKCAIAKKANWKALLQVLKPAMQSQIGKTDLEATHEETVENKPSNESTHELQVPKRIRQNVASILNLEITSEDTDSSITEADSNELAVTSKLKLEPPDTVSLHVPKLDLQSQDVSSEETDESVIKFNSDKSIINRESKLKLPELTSILVLKPAIRNQTSMTNLEVTSDEAITQSHNVKPATTLTSKSVLIAALQPAIRNQTNIADLEITTEEIDDSVKENCRNKPAPKSNWKALLQILKPATPSRISTAHLEITAEETDKNVRETTNNKHPEPSDEISQEVKPTIENLKPNNILITDENFGGKACNNKKKEMNRGLSLTTFLQVSVAGTTSSEAINKTDIKRAKEENYNKTVEDATKKRLHNNEAETGVSKQVAITRNIKSSLKSTSTIKKKMSPKVDLVAESDKAKFKGDAFITGGQYQKAVAEYSRAIEFNPNSAACFYRRAVAYNFLDMTAQCIIDSEKVRELDPKYEKVYGLLGMTYAQLEMFPQAHQAFAEALMFEPKNEIYRGSFYSLQQMLYQPELENARVHEFCYFTDRYEQFKKDPEILDAALPLLKEPSAYNITSILLLNKHVEQQSNVINTFKYLQENNVITVPVHKIPLEHQIEEYSKKEQKRYLFLEKEEKTSNTVPKIGTSPTTNTSPETNAVSSRPKDLIDILVLYKEKKEKDKNYKQKLHK